MRPVTENEIPTTADLVQTLRYLFVISSAREAEIYCPQNPIFKLVSSDILLHKYLNFICQ